MAESSDPRDRRATREGQRGDDEDSERGGSRPRPELQWVELRQPRQSVEIGANGRILDSHFHEGYDAWQVLLETYEEELSSHARQNR